MYKFKDDRDTTVMFFVKARCDGQVVRMYATADTSDAFRKMKEYKDQGFVVTVSCKPITHITREGQRVDY